MAEGDYEIGYGKPPKSGQFQKGKSGNPGGKRKRPLSISQELELELNRRIPLLAQGKSTKKRIRLQSIVVKNLAKAAVGGDLPAIKLVTAMLREETARQELIAAKLEAKKEAAAIARGQLEPEVMRVTLKLESEEDEERTFNARMAAKLAALGYPSDPRIG